MKQHNVTLKFAKRLRDLRKLNKMSQEKLAEKASLSTTFIGYLERAEKEPTLSSLYKIATAFNVSLAELLTFPDDKNISQAKTQDLNKLIEFLEDAIEKVKDYKK
jgi:transcriptional regulator with XRE-family HTH domain